MISQNIPMFTSTQHWPIRSPWLLTPSYRIQWMLPGTRAGVRANELCVELEVGMDRSTTNTVGHKLQSML